MSRPPRRRGSGGALLPVLAVVLAALVAWGTQEGGWMDRLAGRIPAGGEGDTGRAAEGTDGGTASSASGAGRADGTGDGTPDGRGSDGAGDGRGTDDEPYDPMAPFVLPGEEAASGLASTSGPTGASGGPGTGTGGAGAGGAGVGGAGLAGAPTAAGSGGASVTTGETPRGLRTFGLDGVDREPADDTVADGDRAGGPAREPGRFDDRADWERASAPQDTSEEMAAFRVRLELHPADTTALDGLAALLVAEERVDEALEQVARFTAAGGEPGTARRWIDTLDPFAGARRAALDDAVTRLVDRAAWCADRDLTLNRAAFLDAAVTLDGSLVRETGSSADVLAGLRDELLADDDAVATLARADMPLGLDADRHPSRTDEQLARIDERLRARGEANEVDTRHYRVRTEGGELLAWRSADLLQQVHEELQHRFDLPRFGRGGRREVVVHVSEGDYHTARLQQAAPPAEWTLAFLADDGAIVALDPRVRGGSLDQLWGVLAREAARTFVRQLTAPTRPPLWIELGLATTVEGSTRLADGTVQVTRDPPRRRLDVALALSGQAARPYAVDQVVRFRPEDPGATTWAWALARYLRDAEDDDGRPLFRDRFEALVDRYRTDPPDTDGLDRDEIADEDFRLVRQLVVTDEDPRAGIDSAPALQRAFHAWWRAETGLDRREPGAGDLALQRARALSGARRHDEAAATLQRALAADRSDVEAWRQLVAVQQARRDTDRALLAARQVTALTDPRADERWAPVAELAAGLARDLAEDDATLRATVTALVDDYVEAGLPRAARRVVDALLAASPLDVGWRAQRATLTEQLAGGELWRRERLGLVEDVSPYHGDATLFQANGTTLDIRLGDRVRPATLRGLAPLRPPVRLLVQIGFRDTSTPSAADRRTQLVGFTFGAARPEEPGEWGLFVTPTGRVELATQGNLEWPSYSIGQGPPESMELEIRLDERSFEVLTSGRSLGVLPLETRRAEGWLGLYARHVDARLGGLVIERPEAPDPAVAWWTRGR